MRKIPLLFLLFYMTSGNTTSLGPPGKPSLTNCRSPEKETFTCWWKPGSDGGLPTTYALFYYKDHSDTLYECPDYHTAGKNSCFFNKNETSVWVNYNITVVATNDIGTTFSDSVDIDVAYIVQPHTPENVTVTVMEDKGWPFLRVSWESPHKADIRSGWITLVYELRSKIEGEKHWEEHFPGQQKTFNIFSIRSGTSYLVQVRCKPDHGFWSEWTSTTKIKVPEYFFRERSLWIFIAVFSFIALFTLTWMLYLNGRSLKQCILPPIPGPKIKGFDHHHLKDGSYKDGLNSLMIPEFPANSSSNYEDLLVEYLEVSVSGEQEISIKEDKLMQGHHSNSHSSSFDSDSGRGSCDSQTLLTENQKEVKKDELHMNFIDTEELEIKYNNRSELLYQHSSDTCNERARCSSSQASQVRSLKMSKKSFLSDPLHLHGSLLSLNSQNECLRSTYKDLSPSIKQLSDTHLETSKHVREHSDINICQINNARHANFTPTQYVEVQTVNEENMIVLQPLEAAQSQAHNPYVFYNEDYSKIKEYYDGNTDRCFCEKIESNCLKDHNNMHINDLKHQDATMNNTTASIQEQKPCAGSGYVDTAMMFSVSM